MAKGKRKMPENAEKVKDEDILTIRCPKAEREEFARIAELEGLPSRTAWILYHLRRQVKKTLRELEQ